MRIKDKTSFKSGGFYNITGRIQENTILNRGLLDVGDLLYHKWLCLIIKMRKLNEDF